MLVGTGVFQYIFGATPMFSTLGVNIPAVAREAYENDTFGPAIAAAAILSRSEHATNVALGIMLGYATYMLPFEDKGVLHIAMSLGSAMIALGHHQILQQGHHWGRLYLTEVSSRHISLLRTVFGVFALLFWLLSVMSFTAYIVRRKVLNNKPKLA